VSRGVFFGSWLRVFVFCSFAVAVVLSFLAFQPSEGMRLSHSPSAFDYTVLTLLWVATVGGLVVIYREVGRIRLSQLLNAVASGMSSTSLAAFILGFFPEFTGQEVAYSNYMLYSLPLLLIITLMIFYASHKIEKQDQKNQTVEVYEQ